MQTRTYGDLFKITSALIGTGGELDVSEQDQVSHFINRRFQQAFDESPVWPRYSVNSEPRELIALTVTGPTGTESVKMNSNYILLGSQKSGGAGHALTGSLIYCGIGREDVEGSISNAALIYEIPNGSWTITTGGVVGIAGGLLDVTTAGTTRYTELSNSTSPSAFPYEVSAWSATLGASGVPQITQKQSIPYVGGGDGPGDIGPIGDFQRIHKQKAFLNNSALEYDFSVDFEGANILNIVNNDSKVAYVTYKKQFTPFTVTSDYYNSTVEVPAEFFNYIAHAVYADFLRVQNRQDQAMAEEQVAQTYLDLELEKIDIRANNNTINKRFSTYVNRQAR